MNDQPHELEILISRILDHEASDAERDKLHLKLQQDETARALYAATSTLDSAAGQVMRAALGRVELRHAVSAPQHLGLRIAHQPRRRYSRQRRMLLLFSRYATGALAAAIGLLVWLNPPAGHPRTAQQEAQAGSMSSWFAPISTMYESFSPGLPAYERPSLSVRNTQREWLVIPSRDPNQFYLIQVDRSHTKLLNVQQDF